MWVPCLMPDAKFHVCDVFKADRLVASHEADQVKVHVWKGYGSLVVTVTEEGNVILDLCDGEGEVLDTGAIDPEEHLACSVADGLPGAADAEARLGIARWAVRQPPPLGGLDLDGLDPGDGEDRD